MRYSSPPSSTPPRAAPPRPPRSWVARLLREAGAGLETEYSHSLAHARELARRAGERGRVVLAVGGDGMAGCIGGALSGTGTVLGLIPAGRGNDFARALKLPTAAAQLAEVLLRAEPRPVDTVEVTSAVHAAPSSSAACTPVSTRSPTGTPTPRACCAVLPPTTRAVPGRRGLAGDALRVTVDGEEHAFTGYTVVAANSGYDTASTASSPPRPGWTTACWTW
ncbi:diacylglycerol kinase family protein [Streptomyces violaceorubidus]